MVLVLVPFPGVDEESSDGKDKAFMVHESFGSVEFDQGCDHATTHSQVQLGIRLWKLSCVEEAEGRESTENGWILDNICITIIGTAVFAKKPNKILS